MVNTIKLLGFLGHSSDYPAFDDYLIEIGVTQRPKKGGDSTVYIFAHNEKLSFAFWEEDSYNEEYIEQAKSSGFYILNRVSVENGLECVLPFNLSFDTTPVDLDERLGRYLEKAKVPVYTYFKDGILIVARFNSKETSVDSYSFSYPDLYDKKGLGI